MKMQAGYRDVVRVLEFRLGIGKRGGGPQVLGRGPPPPRPYPSPSSQHLVAKGTLGVHGHQTCLREIFVHFAPQHYA